MTVPDPESGPESDDSDSITFVSCTESASICSSVISEVRSKVSVLEPKDEVCERMTWCLCEEVTLENADDNDTKLAKKKIDALIVVSDFRKKGGRLYLWALSEVFSAKSQNTNSFSHF